MIASTSVPLLLAAAAGVGIAHSMLPDHWAPLAVIARANRWSLARTAKTSFLASLGHVAISLVLGVLLAGVGLALRAKILAYEGQIIGGVLVLTGIGFLVWALAMRGHGRGHGHPHPHVHEHPHVHDHEHPHDHAHPHAHGGDAGRGQEPAGRSGSWLADVAVPFGVAASPDLTILPVFVAASAVGVAAAVGSLATFALATIATFVALTLAATIGGYQVKWPWLDRNGHMVSALVLLIIGILVFAGV